MVSFYKNNSSTNTIFNNSGGEIRLYKGSGNGGELVFEVESGYVITVINGNGVSSSSYSVTGLGTNSVSIKNTSGSTLKFDDFEITYSPE